MNPAENPADNQSVANQSVGPVVDGNSRQRARSLAIAGGLLFLVVLFYLLTIFKMGPGVVNRPM